MEAQESVANLAMAYSLGKMESSAAINLLHKIPKEIVATLTRLVRSCLKKELFEKQIAIRDVPVKK